MQRKGRFTASQLNNRVTSMFQEPDYGTQFSVDMSTDATGGRGRNMVKFSVIVCKIYKTTDLSSSSSKNLNYDFECSGLTYGAQTKCNESRKT